MFSVRGVWQCVRNYFWHLRQTNDLFSVWIHRHTLQRSPHSGKHVKESKRLLHLCMWLVLFEYSLSRSILHIRAGHATGDNTSKSEQEKQPRKNLNNPICVPIQTLQLYYKHTHMEMCVRVCVSIRVTVYTLKSVESLTVFTYSKTFPTGLIRKICESYRLSLNGFTVFSFFFFGSSLALVRSWSELIMSVKPLCVCNKWIYRMWWHSIAG